MRQVEDPEVRSYFAERFDRASDGMRLSMASPILNKSSAFTQDPHFRHIVGQPQSTFSLREAIDAGHWIILNLEKGRLGEQAMTLGSLLLTKLKNALFARRKRSLFTLYLDEVQNLVAMDDSLDTLFTESRKFGVGAISANQFLDQYPPAMRSSVLAVNSHVFFQLSGRDAASIATLFDGGAALARKLKSLPKRRMVVRVGTRRPLEARVPLLEIPDVDPADLIRRSKERWSRRRDAVEQAIRERHRAAATNPDEVLDAWD